MDNHTAKLPVPLLNDRERNEMQLLQKKYEKLTEPNAVVKAEHWMVEKTPDKVKKLAEKAKETLGEQELIKQAIEYAAKGFQTLEEMASKATVSEKGVLAKVNRVLEDMTIESLDEVCLVREYGIAKIVNRYKNSHVLAATAEGAATGAFGFAGIAPNLAASLFLYFRAVQSVAMFYGYDIKNDASEMEIASGVLMSAITPKQDAAQNELTAAIGKFMVFTEATVVKQTSKKTWAEMAERGGLSLLITQIRALANVAAKKALEKTGKKGLEQSVFKNILEQLGKKLTKKATGRIMPVFGAAFGALFDTAQMKHIIDYADIFYRKRFIEEKELRINAILNPDTMDDVEIAYKESISK